MLITTSNTDNIMVNLFPSVGKTATVTTIPHNYVHSTGSNLLYYIFCARYHIFVLFPFFICHSIVENTSQSSAHIIFKQLDNIALNASTIT